MSLVESPMYLVDPSREFRPEAKFRDDFSLQQSKDVEEFRNFENIPECNTVEKTYREMHVNQTVDFVNKKQHDNPDDVINMCLKMLKRKVTTLKMNKWKQLNYKKMTILNAVHMLDQLVDESDPDTDLPNSFHAFQTAERIRKKHPDKDWFHLTGLIHDLGKVMALWGEPQYCVVGDTFPVGCQFKPSIVFHHQFENNPDNSNPLYNTKYGIYKECCGLNNVKLSWGHDEYMYQVLTGNKCKLPKEALYVIRFHSFYPWHSSDDYMHLCNDEDLEMLEWVKEFNQFDLYSKSDKVPNVDELTPYYQSLIDKYCPGILQW